MSDVFKEISIDNQRKLRFTEDEYNAAFDAYKAAMQHMSGATAPTLDQWLRARYPKNVVVTPYPTMTKRRFLKLAEDILAGKRADIEFYDVREGGATSYSGFLSFVAHDMAERKESLPNLLAQFAKHEDPNQGTPKDIFEKYRAEASDKNEKLDPNELVKRLRQAPGAGKQRYARMMGITVEEVDEELADLQKSPALAAYKAAAVKIGKGKTAPISIGVDGQRYYVRWEPEARTKKQDQNLHSGSVATTDLAAH